MGRAGVGLWFAALGAPKQELFAAHAVSKLDDVGFILIGARLDFVAGTQTSAPNSIRLVVAEWLWRSLTDPKRLGLRYTRCIVVVSWLFWYALMARLNNHSVP
jgi:N-acetylglucosaminyldiphosphoundecaprenol N-acetyl-beta-D-mannosaminyltransferase